MDKFALFGYPLAHSLSPFIYQRFADQTQKKLSYESILTKPGTLARALQEFRAQGGTGGNITSPLKSEAFTLCDYLTQRAQDALAVNTIYWDNNNNLCGDNTDGVGFEAYLKHHLHLNVQGKKILLLGGGGAAKGIIHPLNDLAEHIVLVTRSPDKAQFFARHPLVKIYNYDTLKKEKTQHFFMVINATSLSLQHSIPPIEGRWLKKAIVVDLAYLQHQKTIFQQWALSQGAKETHDGVGMLVWQGAFSFQSWYKVMPDPAPIIEALQKRNMGQE